MIYIYSIRLEIDNSRICCIIYSQLEVQLENLFEQIFQLIYTHKLKSFIVVVFVVVGIDRVLIVVNNLKRTVFNLEAKYISYLFYLFFGAFRFLNKKHAEYKSVVD